MWSGTHYSIFSSLKKIGEVEILGPYEPGLSLFLARLKNQISLKLLKKRFDFRHSHLLGKAYGVYFSSKLKGRDFDFIIAPAASCELSHLKSKIPVIYITDGTFDSCLNYHKSLSDLLESSVKQGHEIEQQAIAKSDQIIVSSDWAKESVIRDYQADPPKVHVLPYGANFELIPNEEQINYAIPLKWKLLFVGVYWDSKGGDYAFNCFKILHDKGYAVELTVVGCQPPANVRHSAMKVIPFLDKNREEDRKKLYEVFMQHHWLILPTRFDCTPIVINEASAFAIPSVVADTGGIRGHLDEGLNGFAVDYNDKGEGYAALIEKFMMSPENYFVLRKNTRKTFEEKLNWDRWLEEFKKILRIS